jgi:hypothetical protein
VYGACGSLNKMASISPICKKCKTFILALKSPTYRDFMIKKIIKIQDIKISHLGEVGKMDNTGEEKIA